MIRILFILIFAGVAWRFNSTYATKAISFASSLSVFIFTDFYFLKKVPYFKILTALIITTMLLTCFGITLYLLGISISLKGLNQNIVNMVAAYLLLLIFYMGLNYGGTAVYFQKKKAEAESKEIYLVDTSAIIDGRIMDVCRAGFLTKSLVIPEFVIREMQLIADSSIHEKRKKGRRGLSILRKMKESDDLSLNILTKDYENLRGVDNKLLSLAKETKGKIITTDFNLVKVAEVEGVDVINVNQIATILKPQHNVGEKVKVNITKKGNSKKQGVGFLDDDTMVVIDDGEKYIGQTKLAIVTAYIQSETGKMLFCKLI